MNIEDIYTNYALNDGKIISLQLDYKLKKLIVTLQVRRLLAKDKFEPCTIELEFLNVNEVNYFEDFPTNGGYTDITFLKLEDSIFYLSLDPNGNSGLPNAEDNLVIKGEMLTLIDESAVRHSIK